MGIDEKIEAFNYFVFLLIKWYLGINFDDELTQEQLDVFNKNNDFGKAKALLILTLCCFESKNRTEILTIFNNFIATKYGAIEVYLNSVNETKFFEYSYLKLNINTKELFDQNIIKNEIIYKNIVNLKNINAKLIHLPASDLVKINYNYKSWANAWAYAKGLDKSTYPIKFNEIIEDRYLWA